VWCLSGTFPGLSGGIHRREVPSQSLFHPESICGTFCPVHIRMTKKSNSIATEVSREDIAQRAYELWERDGRPEGKAFDHWQQAEVLLRDERNSATNTARGRKAPTARTTESRRERAAEMIS
jgi:hypothetical protein